MKKSFNPYKEVRKELVDGIVRNCGKERIVNALCYLSERSNQFEGSNSAPNFAVQESPLTQELSPYNRRPRISSATMLTCPSDLNSSDLDVERHLGVLTEDALNSHADGSNAIAAARVADVEIPSTGLMFDRDMSELDFGPLNNEPISELKICPPQFAGISRNEKKTRSTPATIRESHGTSRGSVEQEKNRGVNIHSNASTPHSCADLSTSDRSIRIDDDDSSSQNKKPAALPDDVFLLEQQRRGGEESVPTFRRAQRAITTCAKTQPLYYDPDLFPSDFEDEIIDDDDDDDYEPSDSKIGSNLLSVAEGDDASMDDDIGAASTLSANDASKRVCSRSGSSKRKRKKIRSKPRRSLKKQKASRTSKHKSRPRRKITSKVQNPGVAPNSSAEYERYRHIRRCALLRKNSLESLSSLVESPTDSNWSTGSDALYNVACDLTPQELALNKGTCIAGTEFLHSVYEDFSFNKLLSVGTSNSNFEDQCILILKQNSGPSIRNTDTKSPVDPYDVNCIIQINRNKNGQIYTACDLNTSCHLAVSHQVADEIIHRIHFFFGNSEPKLIWIPCTENYHDDEIFVQNVEDLFSGSPLKIKQLFESTCEKGLFSKVKFAEKKRGQTGHDDSVHGDAPVLHFGFTSSNCRANPANRTSTVGSVGPSQISSGFDGLSKDCLSSIVKLISTAEEMCPEGHDIFTISDDNVYRKEYRRQLNEAFNVKYNDKGEPIGNFYMTCEGFTVIIPLVLSAHRDFLNDFIRGMNNVLQINTSVSLNRINFPDPKLYDYVWKMLDKEGIYTTDALREELRVPISIICYSRKVVGQSTEKLLDLDAFATDDTPVTGSDGNSKYNIQLLRNVLRKTFLDTRSSRDVQAMYETNSYINHQVQDDLLRDFSSHRSNLNKFLLEDNGENWDDFNAYYLKNGIKCDKQLNLFADRKDEYDELCRMVNDIPDSNVYVQLDIIREFRSLVSRWYPWLDDYQGRKGNEINYAKFQKERRQFQDRDHHRYYPRPSISNDEVHSLTKSELQSRLSEMKNFFYNVEVFLSITQDSKKCLLALDLADSKSYGPLTEDEEPFNKSEYDVDRWYEACQHWDMDKRIENLRGSVLDCSETFQGPKLQFPAGWDKTRYYWEFIACFLKIAAIREREDKVIEKHDCACFIAYCAITSNGSSDVAEIIRRVSEVTGLFPNRFGEEGMENGEECVYDEYGVTTWEKHDERFDNLYEAMFHFSERRMFHAPGSCKQPRHTYCSQGKSIFAKYYEAQEKCDQYPEYLKTEHCPIKLMLDLFDRCNSSVESDPRNCEEAFNDLKNGLEDEVNGVGSFNVHHVIHMAALLGLIPLKAYGYASLEVKKGSSYSRTEANKKRGPVQFIQACCFDEQNPNKQIPASDIQIIFETVVDELMQIFGKKNVHKSLVENKLCELNRILHVFMLREEKYRKNELKEAMRSDKERIRNSIENCFDIPLSKTFEDPRPSGSDNVYLDLTQCRERLFHPMFHVRFDEKVPYVQMYSHILRRDRTTHSIESMKLTNWDDRHHPKKFTTLLCWESETNVPRQKSIIGKPSYHRKLWMHEKLIKRFLPRYCSENNQCVLCRPVKWNGRKHLKCPNDNQTNGPGHCVFTPTGTTQQRYEVLYKTEVLDFKKKQKSSYPTFNKKLTMKIRDWMAKQRIPYDGLGNDNYVTVSPKKFPNLPGSNVSK